MHRLTAEAGIVPRMREMSPPLRRTLLVYFATVPTLVAAAQIAAFVVDWPLRFTIAGVLTFLLFAGGAWLCLRWYESVAARLARDAGLE